MPVETYNHTADITQIDKIEFSVFGNQEVKRYSVINDQFGINIPEAYDNGEPKQGGLIDKRLGITDNNMYCDTCGLMTTDCPGHFGHTELAEEVFHFGYLDIAKSVLNCICLNCSKLLITKNKDEMIEILGNSHGKNRFAKIKKLTANVKSCQRPDNSCGKPVGKISKEITKSGSIQLMVTYMVDSKGDEDNEGQNENQNQNQQVGKKKKNVEILTPSRVFNIFKNIDDNDYQLMGFDPTKNRPEYFIIKHFPIPPVAIRPSVRLEMLSSGPSEDGLTSKLADIVKDNGRLRKQKDKTLITGEESKYNQDYLQLLQYDIATYFDNESTLPKSEQKGSKASKSVSERLKGKTGRIRGNLMGKRVDFSARTVITSDPNLSLDELGVPIKIAMNITFPEVVTPFNIDRLSKLVRNGRDIYPGANFVLPAQSLELGKKSKIDLRYRKKSVKLHNGDIVERHIVDGDPVLFNRQPSLHKMSMMCHRIRVIKDEMLSTFRINVNVTAPYNADFDGDEMNMFIPQSIQAQLEIANIADVKRQIISPRYSLPIIKLKQDTIIGSFLMTKSTNKIDFHDAMNLSMYCNHVDFFNVLKEDIDPNKLFSLIIPSQINFSNDKVNINNGKLLKGTIGSSVINNKIIYYSWDRHGPDTTKHFLDNSQRLVTNWLLMNGFTVGLGDATTDKAILNEIESFCEIKQMEIDKLITEMENNPDTLDPDTFEDQVQANLSAANNDINKTLNNHIIENHPDNNFHILIESGAKGSSTNISQIIGALGQNILEFKRIKKKVNNRTLPHFFQNDDRANARGFISNSYYHGLNPREFFFHHMTAREGLIDTAIKTSESGYLQRKLTKGMEDIIVAYDKTIRSGNNVLIQMMYGDNNINQTHYKENDINLILMSNTQVANKFKFTSDEITNLIKEFNLDRNSFEQWNNDLYNQMISLRDELRNIQTRAKMNYITVEDKYKLPVNLNRIVEDAKNIVINSKKERLNPLYVYHAIDHILQPHITKINLLNKDYDSSSIKYGDQNRAKQIFKIALLEYLSPRRCIFEYKLTKLQFDQMITDIVKSFRKACVESGEMVGILTAGSLGEVLTQMSITYASEILVLQKNIYTGDKQIVKTKMGKLIDNLYLKYPKLIQNIPYHNGSTEFNLESLDFELYICGVSQDEKVKWNKISHLSRHPANGKLMKIKTASGRELTSTLSHNFLKRTSNGIVPITGADIQIGDRIPLAINIEYQMKRNRLSYNGSNYMLTDNLGWIFGSYIAGCKDMKYINKELIQLIDESSNEGLSVPKFIHNTNIDFIRGFLRGFMDQSCKIDNSINIESRNKKLIDDISLLFRYFGIFCYNNSIQQKYARKYLNEIGSDIESNRENIKKIITNSEIHIDTIDMIPELGNTIKHLASTLKLFEHLGSYDVIEREILLKYIEAFEEQANKLDMYDEVKKDIDNLKMIYNGDVIWDRIEEKIILDDTKEYVYDFTVPGNETFMLYNGLIVHNTLNTFHSSGVGVKGMQGIPRFREILSYSKKIQTPYMVIKLIPEIRDDVHIAHKIEAYLRHTIFNNLIDRMDIIYDPLQKNILEADNMNANNIYYINNSNIGMESLSWLFRFTISRESMLENDITLLDIKTKFIKFWDEFSNDSTTIKKKNILSRVVNGCIISNFDNSATPIIHIRFDINNPDNYTLVEIGQYILNKISIKGVATIDKIDSVTRQQVTDYDDDKGIKKSNEWVIYTSGIDLDKIKTIKYIDFNVLRINDIYMAYLNFGIEAARNLILKECDILYNDSGNPVNITHIGLLADIMSNTGNITSIDRHGINRLDTDPLSRASFEKTVEQLIMASAFNEVDHMRSVSSRIMAGRCIKGGTGVCEVLMDNDFIENSEYNNQKETSISSTKTELEENNLIKDIIKDEDNISEIDMFIP